MMDDDGVSGEREYNPLKALTLVSFFIILSLIFYLIWNPGGDYPEAPVDVPGDAPVDVPGDVPEDEPPHVHVR